MKTNSPDTESKKITTPSNHPIFTGHIYIFVAFDIGDDINFTKIKKSTNVQVDHVHVSKFLKHYHLPLEIELPHPHESGRCISTKIHQFGAISLTYKVPITSSLQELRTTLIEIDEKYQQDSIQDAHSIFKKIKPYIAKPNFFHLKTYYSIIQIDTKKYITGNEIQKKYGHDIASLLRFETESLSEYQKDEIIKSSIGYFKKDLIVIDTQAAFIYDPQYEELLDFFELGNIQQLELHYFDKLLDKQLATIYEQKAQSLPILSYMPFIGSRYFDPVGDLNRLKVDISVITERLESSIKIAGEAYFSEIYDLIVNKMNLKDWQRSIERKFNIVKEMRYVYQSKVDANREDLLSVLIIILIMIELMIALLKH